MFTKGFHCIATALLAAALCQCSVLFDLGTLDEGPKSHDATSDERILLDGADDNGSGDAMDEHASGDDDPLNDSNDDKEADDGGFIAGDGSETASDAPSDAGDANEAEAAVCPSSWLPFSGAEPAVEAYASSTADGNPPMNAIDGIFTTRWKSAPMDPQYLYLDFGPGSQVAIERVQIIWGGNSCAKDYRLEVSNDGATWKPIRTILANTVGTPTPPPPGNPWAYAVDSLGLSAQGEFLRVFTTASCGVDGYSIWEMRVFGHKIPCR
jgi:hypothetical protein